MRQTLCQSCPNGFGLWHVSKSHAACLYSRGRGLSLLVVAFGFYIYLVVLFYITTGTSRVRLVGFYVFKAQISLCPFSIQIMYAWEPDRTPCCSGLNRQSRGQYTGGAPIRGDVFGCLHPRSDFALRASLQQIRKCCLSLYKYKSYCTNFKYW